MAKYSSSINYKITTSLDASGITKLQAELNKLEHEFTDLNARQLISDKQVTDAVSDINRIRNALATAFNPRLGMTNMSVLMSELTKGGRSLNQIYNNLGTRGTAAMTQLYGQLGKIDTGMKSVSKTTDKVFNTLGNTVRWGVIASGFQYVLNSAHSAVQYMRDLDESLTNIRMVTDESKESMREFALYANKAAQSLGNTTVAYTDAALIYAQQGYALDDQKILADYTLMTANATGQDTKEVSTQMTSMINGFKLSVDEVGGALDVLAKVANTSAADMEELSTATAKVASTANTLGVTQEQLTAQIATIVSVTREAPENVGNALKTIYARFGDLSLGETLEDGTDLGKVSGTLEKIGVQVLDDTGAMRDMGAIMEDLMAVWDTLDTANKQATAVTIAGKYQYNRLMALMENSDMYSNYLNDAKTSEGTLETMQSEYMESLEGKTNALIASLQGALTSLFDQNDFGVIVDGLTEIVNLFTTLTESIGGGSAALTAFGAVATKTFSNNIGRSISNMVANREKSQWAEANIQSASNMAQQGLLSSGVGNKSQYLQQFATDIEGVNKYAGLMNQEQIDQTNQRIEKYSQAVLAADKATKDYEQGIVGAKMALASFGLEAGQTDAKVIALVKQLEAGDASIDGFDQSLMDLLDTFLNTQMSVSSLYNALDKMGQGVDNLDWHRIIRDSETLHKNFEKLIPSLKQAGASSEEINKLSAAMQKLGKMTEGEVEDIASFRNALQLTDGTLEKFTLALQDLVVKGELTASQLEELKQKFLQAKDAAHAMSMETQGAAASMQMQSMASHIASAAGAAMSLVFAVQSFQALGSIWANNDLTIGEKFSQTLMNGTMAVAMLAMAYNELAMFKAAVIKETGAETLAQGLQIKIREALVIKTTELAAAERALAAARASGDKAAIITAEKEVKNLREKQLQNTTAQMAGVKATDILTKAFSKFGTVLKILRGPLGWITLAVGAAASAFGFYSKQVEEAAKRQAEATAKAQEDIESRTKLAENFSDLYESYKEGNATSEELKTAADELNGVLDDQALAVMAAAGEWENYYNWLKQSVDLANQNDLGTLIAGKETNKDNFVGDWGYEAWNGGFFKTFATTAAAQGVLGQMEMETSAISRNYRGEYNWDVNSSAEERVRDYAKATSLLTEKLEALDLAFAQGKISQDTYNASVREVNSELTNLKRLETEGFNNYKNSLEAPAQIKAKTIGEQLGDTGDYQAIIDAYFSDEQTREYLESLGSWSEQLEWIISQTTNETQKIALLMQQSKESFGASAKEKVSATLEAQNIDTAKYGVKDKDEYADLIVADMLTQIEKSGLTEEEQINFIAGIDWSKSLPEIQAEIDNISVSGTLPKLAFEPTLTDRSSFSDTQISELLEDTEMSEAGFQRMSAHIFENSDIGTRADAIEAEIAALEASGDQSEETTKKIAELRKEYEGLGDTAKDIAARNLQMNKGLSDLTESWEDLADVLQNDAAKGTADYFNAVGQLDEILSDILNIDVGVLSEGFYQNEAAIQAMEAAANGDAAAVDTLRELAAEDIIMNLDVQNISPEDKDYLINNELLPMLSEFQGKLDDMPLGATVDVDTDPFIQKLNQLAAAGQLSAEQLTNILSSVGMEATIEEEKSEPVWNETKMKWPQFQIDPETGIVQPTGEHTEISTYTQSQSSFPKITGAKYTGSGVNTVGSSSGGGGKKSGGGGGGGGSKKAKTEKKSEEKADRYQNVNAHLDRLSTSLEKVADEQDRLAGKDMLENMAEQVELIKQQAEWHQKKLDIQKEEAAELRNELGQDYGITFDSDGFMTNYQEIHKQLVAEYDALVDQYNATSDEEGQEKIKEKMDAVKEKIDNFNEAWERYDELMNNEIPESMNTLEDLEDQIEDLRIEAFNAYIEAAENIKDIQDAWADFVGFMSGLEPDSPFRSLIEDAEKYENSIDLVVAKQQDLDKLMQWAPQYQAGGVISSDNPFGENSAEYYEALQAAYESYIEAVLEAESLYYDQIDDILEGYDEIADKIGKRMESYARLGEQLDHYASVIETLYGEEDYDNLLALKRANQDVLESSVEQARKNLSMWQGELAKYNRETQPEIWEAIHEKVVEAQGELEGLVEEAAENTAAILEMAVDKTVKEWKDTMLGGDATWAETQWEMAKELADQYLDTVEETYEIEKLRSKYNNLANDTMDLNLRKRINEQMEKELKYLQEKDKLSEYDVNYANAKLEILQKQIALEEAQANKNQMKLRRDSQGNYSYVYAADKDDVAKAQSDLMDAEFNAYDMSKENYMTNYDNYISAVNSAAERIKEINANTLLSEEEKAKRTQEIYDWLEQYLSGVAEQIGVSQQGMIESVAWLAQDTTGIVGDTFKDISQMMQDDWIAALENIGVATNENFAHVIENMEQFLEDTQEKWAEFEDHTQEWAENVEDIADEGTEGFRDVDNIIIDIREDMKDLNEETETFFDLINDDLGTIDAAVGKLAEYEAQIQGLKESTSKTVAQLEEARQSIVAKDNEIRDLQGEIDRLKNGGGEDGSGGGGSTSGGGGSGDGYAGTKYTREQLIEGLAGNIWVYADWQNDPTRADSLTKKFNKTVAQEVQAYVNKGMGALKHEYAYYKNFAPSQFDTGGYTGIWGKEGRLAMLHQKELVLNAQDTENILSAVGVIREIVAAMKSDSLSSFASAFKNNNIATNTGNNIEQNVSIYADFPAAESAAEIKAALEGLTQQAVQYAKRTR